MIHLFSPLRRQRSAFEQEAMPHLEALHTYALHLCRDAADADDLVQETYIKALQNWASYEQGTNCRAWLFRILTNTYFNLRRTRRRHNPVDIDATPDLQMQAAEASQQTGIYRPIDLQLLDGVVSRHVQEAVDSLPPEFRSVLLLADLQEFSYKEIAEVLDCPVGTVMSRLYRARKAMQKQLVDHAIREGIVQRPPVDEAGVIDMDAFRLRARRAAS
ncbi:MAG: sigma-70 family RNA polymerase sigma factor [Deltaproteobacteria bacterium]|nr:sigma-70 family RNA polymerase sigma factor [Deltaproteobacteria bacterium]